MKPSSAPSAPAIDTAAPISGIPAAMNPPNTMSITTRAIGSATASPRFRSFSEISTIDLTSSRPPPTSTTASGCDSRSSSAAARSSSFAASTSPSSGSARSTPSTVTLTRNPSPPSATRGARAGITDPSGNVGTPTGVTTEVWGRSSRRATRSATVCTASGSSTAMPSASRVNDERSSSSPARTSSARELSPFALGASLLRRSKRDSPARPPTAVATAPPMKRNQTTRVIQGCRAAAPPIAASGPRGDRSVIRPWTASPRRRSRRRRRWPP